VEGAIEVRTVLSVLAALAALAPSASLSAQDKPKLPKWKIDRYTENHPEVLARMGYVSYGPFPFGQRATKVITTEDIEKHLAHLQIRWVETAHFRIGMDLGAWTVPVDPEVRSKIREELTRLGERGLPKVTPKMKQLDPWLRLHLTAQRLEEHYALMQDWLGVTDADFPKNAEERFQKTNEYWGEGPYLGQPEKYLFLILEDKKDYDDYLVTYTGRISVGGQQWNFKETGALLYAFATKNPEEDGRLDDDTALHGHLVFSATHNLINGFLHYNFDLPVWMREGPAHWFERKITPRYNSFTRGEGAAPIDQRQWRFDLETRKLLSSGKYTSFVEIMKMRDFGEMEFDDHVMTWSRQDYLMSLGKEKWAKFMRLAKAQVDPLTGQVNGDIVDATRDALKDAYGLSPLLLEEKWKDWVKSTYPTK
jgi:hypothetical protein